MAIAFNCQSCGKTYRVADHLAGTVVTCTQCKGAMDVPTTIEKDAAGEVVAQAARVTPKEFVAPPPTVAHTPQPSRAPSLNFPSAAATPKQPNPFLMDEPEQIADDDILLAPPAFSPQALSLPPQSPPPRAPAKPLVPYKPPKPEAPRLLFTDDVAKLISGLLLLVLAAGLIYFSHRIVSQEWLPDELQSRLRGYLFMHTAWEFLMFFILIVPTMLLACTLACNWTKWDLPVSPYIRAAGVATLPSLTLFAIIALVAARNWWGLGVLILIAPFVAVIMLKELMGMKWSTAAVTSALLLVLIPLAGIAKFAAEWYAVVPAFKRLASIDEKSMEAWRAEHPEEFRAAQQKHFEELAAKAKEMQGLFSSTTNLPPPQVAGPAPDPYAGKIEGFNQEVFDAVRQASYHTREELEAQFEKLTARFAEFPPRRDSASWHMTDQKLKEFRVAMGRAPSESPPEEIYQPVEDRPLAVARPAETELSDTTFAFKSLRIRPLKSSKIDLKAFEHRDGYQRWLLNDREGIMISVFAAPDSQQQRPWLSEFQIIHQLANKRNLAYMCMPKGAEVSHGTFNKIAWTRVASRPHAIAPINRVSYMGRISNAWVQVDIPEASNHSATVDAMDKFVQGITEANAPDAAGEDPFAPKYIVERFAEPLDEPTPIFRAGGKPAVEVLREYVHRMGDDAPFRAQRLLTELTGERPKESPAEKPTLAVLMVLIKDAKSSFDKREMIQQLAGIPVDESRRDEVAGMLEQLLLGDEASFVGDAAGEALAKWWRPHTVAVLLPLMEENVWPPSKRQAAMKVLVKTGDRRAVLPIARWIIKEPEAVVAALTEMGQVAEDEVVKLLRDKSPAVRANASRILEQIGTNKCLPELRRAASDPRDPVAAGVARAAVEMVVERVRQSKSAATQPSTRAAASVAP